MKITAREEYGLRCLLQLARGTLRGSTMTVRAVAEGEGISIAYAEKILRALSRASLAESIRGAHGGYRITRSPEDVTLGEVFRALGGFVSSIELCSRFTGISDCCVHAKGCGVRPVWNVLNNQIERFLDQLTLSSLLESEHRVAAHVETLVGLRADGRRAADTEGPP